MTVTLCCSASMYKKIIFAVVMMVLVFTGNVTVQAQQASLSMYVREEIKVGKAFGVYLSVSSDNPVGAEHIRVCYPADTLTFKSASPESKTDSEMFSCYDNDGMIEMIFLSRNHQSVGSDIVLHFQPNDSETIQYDFDVSFCEACDTQGENIPVAENSVFSFKAVSSYIVTSSAQNSADEQSRSVSGQSSQVSQITSSVKKEKSASSDEISPEEEKEEAASNDTEPSGIYRVIHVEPETSQKDLFLFAGIVTAIVICMAVVYKMGFRHGKETEKKTDH